MLTANVKLFSRNNETPYIISICSTGLANNSDSGEKRMKADKKKQHVSELTPQEFQKTFPIILKAVLPEFADWYEEERTVIQTRSILLSERYRKKPGQHIRENTD